VEGRLPQAPSLNHGVDNLGSTILTTPLRRCMQSAEPAHALLASGTTIRLSADLMVGSRGRPRVNPEAELVDGRRPSGVSRRESGVDAEWSDRVWAPEPAVRSGPRITFREPLPCTRGALQGHRTMAN